MDDELCQILSGRKLESGLLNRITPVPPLSAPQSSWSVPGDCHRRSQEKPTPGDRWGLGQGIAPSVNGKDLSIVCAVQTFTAAPG
ncbi:hypothetical protein ACOMHN_049926 [Nucella lapillus]